MEERARAAGIETVLAPLEAADPERDLPDDDGTLLVLGTPTHGFTAPWAAIRFALRLPRRRRARAVVVSTRAGWKPIVYCRGITGTTLALLALILRLRGYRVRGLLGVDMPSNWIALHPGMGETSVAHFLQRGRPRAERFLEKVLAGRRSLVTPDNVFEFLVGLALLPVSGGYLLFGRFYFAKLFFYNERCDGCAVCAKGCPVGGIRMRGAPPRPYWTFTCESCMRCMNFCPHTAIEAGHSLALLLYLATSVPVGVLLLNRVAGRWPAVAAVQGVGAVQFMVQYPFFLLSLFATYLAVHLLIRNRVVNALFSYTTFTRLYRRYREPATKLKDLKRPAA
jgi:Pyruvate/2-oxoacid:ferredoxin oxidoreductase delta subunit